MQTPAFSSSPLYPNAQPFFGIVENTVQALRLVHAAQRGVIPRVLRRLNQMEKIQMIVSGAIFVFGVEESGIRRWTDGRVFSPSRIDGNFLVYKELSERSGSRRSERPEVWVSMSGEGGRQVQLNTQGQQYRPQISFAAASDASTGGIKIGGLVKRTITVKVQGSDHHLVSYHTQEDVISGRFRPMSSRYDIMTLDLPPHIFTFSNFRYPPRVERRDGVSSIVCEPETEHHVMNPHSKEDIRHNNTTRQMWVAQDTSGLGLTTHDAPASSIVENRVVRGHVATENWEEQLDSEQTIPQYNLHQTSQSSVDALSEGEQINQTDYAFNKSQHQFRRWPSLPPSSDPFAMMDEYPSYFHPRDNGGHESGEEMRQVEQSFVGGYNRDGHGQSPNSRPALPPAYHPGIDNAWPSNDNTFTQSHPSELDNMASRSQSRLDWYPRSHKHVEDHRRQREH